MKHKNQVYATFYRDDKSNKYGQICINYKIYANCTRHSLSWAGDYDSLINSIHGKCIIYKIYSNTTFILDLLDKKYKNVTWKPLSF